MNYENHLRNISAPKNNEVRKSQQTRMLENIKKSLKKLNYTTFTRQSFINRLLKLNIITNPEKNKLMEKINWNIPAESLHKYDYSRRMNKAQNVKNLNSIKNEFSQSKIVTNSNKSNLLVKYSSRKNSLNKLNPSRN